jgi:hypothetical protein
MKKFFSFQDPIVQPPAETMTNVDETYFRTRKAIAFVREVD